MLQIIGGQLSPIGECSLPAFRNRLGLGLNLARNMIATCNLSRHHINRLAGDQRIKFRLVQPHPRPS
jgi:hypothetical protein